MHLSQASTQRMASGALCLGCSCGTSSTCLSQMCFAQPSRLALWTWEPQSSCQLVVQLLQKLCGKSAWGEARRSCKKCMLSIVASWHVASTGTGTVRHCFSLLSVSGEGKAGVGVCAADLEGFLDICIEARSSPCITTPRFLAHHSHLLALFSSILLSSSERLASLCSLCRLRRCRRDCGHGHLDLLQ